MVGGQSWVQLCYCGQWYCGNAFDAVLKLMSTGGGESGKALKVHMPMCKYPSWGTQMANRSLSGDPWLVML